MANLIPTPIWAAIRQIEINDRVLGGPGGIANQQAQELLNRTEFIKAKGAALPFDPDENYDEDALVLKDGVLSKLVSGEWRPLQSPITVSCTEWGIFPNTGVDVTDKISVMTNDLRSSGKIGWFPPGEYVVSPKFVRTFGPEQVNYCVDISGITLWGAIQGYRNANGAIFRVSEETVRGTNSVVLMQAQQSARMITYAIKGFAFRNADVCLRMTYAVHSEIDHLYANSTCERILILGEDSFDSGPLFNRFSNVNGAVSGCPVELRGKLWNNANIFENFYVSGGEPSRLNVKGGYGAIANVFIGGEFASLRSGTHGIELGRAASTSFLGTYFEAHGHAVVLDHLSRNTLMQNCTYGTTSVAAGESENPAFIYHRGKFTASICIDGGVVFLGNGDGQKNMRLIESANASLLSVDVIKPPVLGGSNPGYLIFSPQILRSLSTFRGHYAADVPLEFSSSGGSVSGLPASSGMSFVISGGLCTAHFRLDYNQSANYGDGIYYLRLPRTQNQAQTPLGVTFTFPGGSVANQLTGVSSPTEVGNLVTRFNRNSVTSTQAADGSITSKLVGSEVALNRALMESLGVGGFVRGTISYRI